MIEFISHYRLRRFMGLIRRAAYDAVARLMILAIIVYVATAFANRAFPNAPGGPFGFLPFWWGIGIIIAIAIGVSLAAISNELTRY